jgi:plastocyanin domain-containing protein
MTGMELVVVATAVAALVWVNWYFFLSERSSGVAVPGGGGVQEVGIVVRGGYEPAVVRAKKGVPLRLVFAREETSGCSEEVVFPEFGVKKYLPAHEQTVVEIVPERAGTYEFTCGMGMLRGRLVVEE